MTRKDFQLIADIIRKLPRDESGRVEFDAIVREFGDGLAGTNSNFAVVHFEKVCYGMKELGSRP